MTVKLPSWTIDNDLKSQYIGYVCYICKETKMKIYKYKDTNIEYIKCENCSFQMDYQEFIAYTMKWIAIYEKGKDENNKIAGSDSL